MNIWKTAIFACLAVLAADQASAGPSYYEYTCEDGTYSLTSRGRPVGQHYYFGRKGASHDQQIAMLPTESGEDEYSAEEIRTMPKFSGTGPTQITTAERTTPEGCLVDTTNSRDTFRLVGLSAADRARLGVSEGQSFAMTCTSIFAYPCHPEE